jgi:hypothetical protein
VPARIMVVYNDNLFLPRAMAELRAMGHDVFGTCDPISALTTLHRAHNVELLITCVDFPAGHPSGVSLALMALHNRPQPKPAIKVLFVDKPEFHEYARHIGEWLAEPVAVAEIVAAADRLLTVPSGPVFGDILALDPAQCFVSRAKARPVGHAARRVEGHDGDVAGGVDNFVSGELLIAHRPAPAA